MYNPTDPLPYASTVNNRIYEFNPFLKRKESTGPELESRCRSISERSKGRSSSPPALIKRAKSMKSLEAYSGTVPSERVRSRPTISRYYSSGLTCMSNSSSDVSGFPSPNISSQNSFHSPAHSIDMTSRPPCFSLSETTNFASTFTYTSDASDLESLPDLVDDATTPTSSPFKKSVKSYYFQESASNIPSKFAEQISHFLPQPPQQHSPSIFEIPEIVHMIVEFSDIQNTVIPQESSPIRRKPLSFNHALLIHGDKKLAEIALNEQSPNQSTSRGVLFNCLLVNKLFHQVTLEILGKKVFFSDEHKLQKFLNSCKIKFRPQLFVLHKLFQLKQSAIETIKNRINFDELEWLELYMCPKLLPTSEFLSSMGKLKKLILTGSKVVDDNFLSMVSKNCPNLQILDIRACELVSDSGIYQIGNECRKLTNINFGRKSNGYLVTDHSVSRLISKNSNLETVGLAGCNVSDQICWDLATNCPNLQRLSLNNCPMLLNQSIPMILAQNDTLARYFTKLSVLELRFNYQITQWQPIIAFKRRQEFSGMPVLVELCEDLTLKMRQQEFEMDRLISQRILEDILDWVNASDDDMDFPLCISASST